jgi:hypothetical protein
VGLHIFPCRVASQPRQTRNGDRNISLAQVNHIIHVAYAVNSRVPLGCLGLRWALLAFVQFILPEWNNEAIRVKSLEDELRFLN